MVIGIPERPSLTSGPNRKRTMSSINGLVSGTPQGKGYTTPGGPRQTPNRRQGKTYNQRSGLAAKALRRTIRSDIRENRFGGKGIAELNPQQLEQLQNRLRHRMANINANPNQLGNRLGDRYQDILGGLRRQNTQQQGSNGNINRRADQLDRQGRQRLEDELAIGQDPPGLSQVPSYVNINSNGQLDLPYSEKYGWELLQQKEAMNNQLLNLQQQQQQEGLDYQAQNRDANLQFGDVQRDTLNNFGSRGMAFSSGYGNAVGQNSTQFNNFMNDLQRQHSIADANFTSQRSGIETAFNDYLRKAAYDQALDLSGQAGDLGYGRSTPGNTYGDPSKLGNAIHRRPKPKPKPKAKNKRKGRR